MDLFKILGKIAVDGIDKAVSDLKSTTNEASKSSTALGKIGTVIKNAFGSNKTEAFGVSLERLTSRVSTQQNKVEMLKQKYADLYLTHGKNSDEAKEVAEEIEKLSKELVENRSKLSEAEAAANEFDASLEDAGEEAEEFGEKSEEAAEKSSSAFSKIGGVILKGVGAAITAATTAIVALGKSSISAYADYEQLVGGVETLFGAGGANLQEYADSVGKSVNEAQREYRILMDAQNEVFDNANNAYKTAGLSANEYMETVTSFSASLIQSLDGDTRAAAKYADMAITDMSDNANKMGTDMASIQTAYQGFAKQNYTMLDNLKLGYAGTKEGVEALVAKANELKAANGETADLTIDSFADIAEAIHLVQDEMGITGTTAKEASSTIQGSVASMKGAWQNFVTGLADENADLDQLMGNMVDSVVTVGDNIIPRIQTLLPRIAEGLTTLASKVAEQLPGIMETIFPSLLTSAANLVVTLVQGIVDTLPLLIPAAVEAITTITTGLMEMLPEITQAAIDIIVELANGLAEALPDLIPTVVSIILEIATILTDPANLTALIGAAIEIITALANGLLEALPQLIDQAPEIISSLVEAIKENAPEMLSAAVEIITSLATGIGENLGEIGETAGGAISSLVEGLEDFVTWLSEGSAGAEALKATVVGITAAFVVYKTITTAITVAQRVWSAITKVVSAAQAALNAVMNANPIMIIILAIAALVAAFIYLWNNCEGFRQFFLDMWEGIKTAFAAVVDWFSQALSDIAQFFTTAWNGIKSTVSTVLNAIKGVVSTIWGNIKTNITTVINGIKSTVSNVFNGIKSTVSNVFNGIKSVATSVWNGIKTAMTTPIEKARDAIKTIVDKIKGFFSGLKLEFPNIKLPHFSIAPSGWKIGDLLQGSIPKLSISWYAKGGVLDEPTIFGVNGNTLMGGGEAGKEAVAPIDVLQGYVADAVASQNTVIVSVLEKILVAIESMDANMGGNLRDAVDGLRVDMNRREVGRIVRAVT